MADIILSHVPALYNLSGYIHSVWVYHIHCCHVCFVIVFLYRDQSQSHWYLKMFSFHRSDSSVATSHSAIELWKRSWSRDIFEILFFLKCNLSPDMMPRYIWHNLTKLCPTMSMPAQEYDHLLPPLAFHPIFASCSSQLLESSKS